MLAHQQKITLINGHWVSFIGSIKIDCPIGMDGSEGQKNPFCQRAFMMMMMNKIQV